MSKGPPARTGSSEPSTLLNMARWSGRILGASKASKAGQGHSKEETLDRLVRRVDEDRWLASRLAPPADRASLIALYAFAYEIAKIPENVSDRTLAAIRLHWWRDQIEAMLAGGEPDGHPAALALRDILHSGRLPMREFTSLLETRLLDYEPEPFETWADVEAYLDGTAGALLRLCAFALWPAGPWLAAQDQALTTGARAWGLIGLVRALPHWTARRRTIFPRKLMERVQLTREELFAPKPGHAFVSATAAFKERAASLHKDARALAIGLPACLFPALAYVALVPNYLKALQRGAGQSRPDGKSPLLERQLRLIAAAAQGGL